MHKPSLLSLGIGLIPFAAMCFSVSLWDHLYPFVLGMPFNMFWLCLWVVLTPVAMAGAYKIEKARQKQEGQHE